MKKFKLYNVVRPIALVLAPAFVLPILSACNKEKQVPTKDPIAIVQKNYEALQSDMETLFPTMSEDLVENASLILMLDEIAPEDENGKVNAEYMSLFKSKLDVDNMMNDFNSFLNILEQTMIEKGTVYLSRNLVIESDEEILSKIEKIVINVIGKNNRTDNFNLLYTLFVEENEITYDGLTFSIRDLSYPSRALAAAYARTAAYFAKSNISEEQYKMMDERTNNQNSKAYIKTRLEIVANQMEEISEIDVATVFNNKYAQAKEITNNKINVPEDDIKNLVNYVNLEYLDSDIVANKDKNSTLGEYKEEKISNVLVAIDAITEYNQNNQDDIILLSDMLIDEYERTATGEVDSIVLDYIQYNAIKLLSTTTEEMSASEIYNNPYFQNIYKYLIKSNLNIEYKDGTKLEINYQNISDGAKFAANEVIRYTLNKRAKVYEYKGYEEKVNTNLEETIQYIQNTVTGECEKAEIEEFVKTK